MRAAVCFLLFVAAILQGGCAGSIYPELQSAKKSHKPIFVGNIGASRSDKKGDISALAHFFNTSPKTYRYVDITVEAYNRFGDQIMPEEGESALVKLRFTGPLPPRRSPGILTWPKTWYVSSVDCLDIKRIDLIHMDGSTLAIEGPSLADVLAAKLRKSCARV